MLNEVKHDTSFQTKILEILERFLAKRKNLRVVFLQQILPLI